MIGTVRKVYDNWFLSEPALHAMLCTHRVVENTDIACSVRTGSGKIEYNPNILEQMAYPLVEELFRIEVIRILLGHPYMRQPVGVARDVLTVASDITISNYYQFDDIDLDSARKHNLPSDKYYEWYAHELNGEDAPRDGDSDSKYGEGAQDTSPRPSMSSESPSPRSEQSELWCGDDMALAQIRMEASRITRWGSLPQPLVADIMASRAVKADYKQILAHFRQTTLSSHRRMTRMRPNRRTDLLQMGSIYQMQSRILVAVDTSGSISDAEISRFYGLIGNLFRRYSTVIDTVQFDVKLSSVVPLKRAPRCVTVTQRGGTSFQPIVDFSASCRDYDGIIVLTDGLAPQPSMMRRPHIPILWAIVPSGVQLPEWLLQSLHCILPTN